MTTEQRLGRCDCRRARRTLHIPIAPHEVQLVRPARLEHGDWSTNVALVVAKSAGRAPREVAAELASALRPHRSRTSSRSRSPGQGFVNFKLANLGCTTRSPMSSQPARDNYATPELGAGERVQIEFVSANPTGPLHVGNGWLGSYGDALGRVMSRCGWDVRREFYVNDTGGQIRLLGESLLALPSRRGRARGGLSGRVRHPPRG